MSRKEVNKQVKLSRIADEIEEIEWKIRRIDDFSKENDFSKESEFIKNTKSGFKAFLLSKIKRLQAELAREVF